MMPHDVATLVTAELCQEAKIVLNSLENFQPEILGLPLFIHLAESTDSMNLF